MRFCLFHVTLHPVLERPLLRAVFSYQVAKGLSGLGNDIALERFLYGDQVVFELAEEAAVRAAIGRCIEQGLQFFLLLPVGLQKFGPGRFLGCADLFFNLFLQLQQFGLLHDLVAQDPLPEFQVAVVLLFPAQPFF